MFFKSRSSRSLALASASVLAMSAAAHAQTPADVTDTITITVTGSRVIQDAAQAPTPLTVVSSQQLLDTTPSNLMDGLNKLPVFQNSATRRNAGNAGGNGGGSFLNLRNFGQQRTLTLLDGMRLPNSNQGGSVDISILPQTLVSRVDVVTGGASAVYGSDAVTGVANFILDKNFSGFKYDANAGISKYGDGFQYKMEMAAGTSILGDRGHIEGSLQWSAQDGVRKMERPSGAKNLGAYNSGGNALVPLTNINQAGLTVATSTGRINCTAAGAGLRLPCGVNGYEFGQPGVPTPMVLDIPNTVPGDPASRNTAIAQNCPTCARVSNTSIFGDARNATAFGRFSYKLTDDIVFFTQVMAAEAYIHNYFFPMQSGDDRQTTTYFRNNAFLPAATQTALGNNSGTNPNWATDGTNTFKVSMWYNEDDRTRETRNVSRNLISSSGFNGVIFGDWQWNAHFTHGETRLSTTGIHNGNNQFHVAAQDAVIENGTLKCWNETAAAIAQFGRLYPGCVPINVFGRDVSSQEAIDYWGRNTHFTQTNTMDDIAADISGELWNLTGAGAIRVAVSGEMRWLDYVIDSNASPTQIVNCYGLRLCWAQGTGTIAAPHARREGGTGFVDANEQQYVTQTLWDNNTLPSVQANMNVWEFSGEIAVPLLADVPFAQAVDLSLAARHTDYSTSGAVDTWKAGLTWQVDDNVRLRGGTSIDIRAPTLNDLYSPATSNSGPFLDPLTNFNPGGIQTVSAGNPNLKPEVARTYTAGAVFTPTFWGLDGLTFSADYYHIKLSNAIVSISGTNTAVANLCIGSGGTSQFCSLYDRPLPYSNTTTANYPTLIRSQLLNAAFNVLEGQDYEANYSFDLANVMADLKGRVDLRALVTVQPVNSTSNFSGAPLSHTTSQKGRTSIFATYTLNDWSVSGQYQWFSGQNRNAVVPPCAVTATGVNAGQCTGRTFYAFDRVTDFDTFAFTVTKRFTFENGAAMQAYFNVQNVFNNIPPDVNGSNANPGGINTPAGEDLMGRYFTLGFRGNF